MSRTPPRAPLLSRWLRPADSPEPEAWRLYLTPVLCPAAGHQSREEASLAGSPQSESLPGCPGRVAVVVKVRARPSNKQGWGGGTARGAPRAMLRLLRPGRARVGRSRGWRWSRFRPRVPFLPRYSRTHRRGFSLLRFPSTLFCFLLACAL